MKKILLQIEKKTPTDWDEIESNGWLTFPNKAKVVSINVQGVEFSGFEKYALQELNGGNTIKVYAWNLTNQFAQVWTMSLLFEDPDLGTAVNTKQSVVTYSDDPLHQAISNLGATVLPWSSFVVPGNLKALNGTSLQDVSAYTDIQSLKGWREWTEGVPEEFLDDDGKVAIQKDLGKWKEPDGTLTFIQRNLGIVNNIHSADHEMGMNFDTATAANLIGVIAPNSTELTHIWSTVSNPTQPNQHDWPRGNYRCQLDCVSGPAVVTYGLLGSGHFARVDSGLNNDLATKTQQEAIFNGTGLKLATTGVTGFQPVGQSSSDRFEVVVQGTNADLVANKRLTFEVNTSDSFVDGPWLDPAKVPHQSELTNPQHIDRKTKVVGYGPPSSAL